MRQFVETGNFKFAVINPVEIVVAAHNRSSAVERFLILFAALVGGWFVLFEVYPPSSVMGDVASKSLALSMAFFALTLAHFVSLASGKLKILFCLFHFCFWGTWGVFAFTADKPTMATPLFSGLAVMALYEAFRIKFKEDD